MPETALICRVPEAERYIDRMPREVTQKIISIEEGSTPLVPAPALSKRVDADVFLKLEEMGTPAGAVARDAAGCGRSRHERRHRRRSRRG